MPRRKNEQGNVTQFPSPSAELSTDTATKEVVKKKRDWIPNPQKDFGQENVEPGDNARYLRYARVALDLPPIDISDPEQVEQRINEYFDFCEKTDRKPNIIGVGNWVGVSRDTINAWKRGEYRRETHTDMIKKVMCLLEEMWVDYMMNGKVNPGSGIFIGKNLFGYRDVVDLVNATPQPLGETMTQKELEEKLSDVVAEIDTEEI